MGEAVGVAVGEAVRRRRCGEGGAVGESVGDVVGSARGEVVVVGVGVVGVGANPPPRMSTSMHDVKISSVYLQIQSQRNVAGPEGVLDGMRTC